MAKKRITARKATKRKAAPVKRKRRITGAKKVASSGAIGSVKKAKAIMANINKLERERRTIKGKEMKDIIQLCINAEHDKIDNLKRQLKR